MFLKTGKTPKAHKYKLNEDLTQSENELKFSYCFPNHLKLNEFEHHFGKFSRLIRIDRDDVNRASEEQENINRAIGLDGNNSSKLFLPDIGNHQSSTSNLEHFLQKEGFSKKGVQKEVSSPLSSQNASRLISLMKPKESTESNLASSPSVNSLKQSQNKF